MPRSANSVSRVVLGPPSGGPSELSRLSSTGSASTGTAEGEGASPLPGDPARPQRHWEQHHNHSHTQPHHHHNSAATGGTSIKPRHVTFAGQASGDVTIDQSRSATGPAAAATASSAVTAVANAHSRRTGTASASKRTVGAGSSGPGSGRRSRGTTSSGTALTKSPKPGSDKSLSGQQPQSRGPEAKPIPIPRFLSQSEVQRAESRVFALISELFQLESHGWLRRQIVGVTRTLLRLAYSGAGSRRIARAYFDQISVPALADWLRFFRVEVMWKGPGGTLRTPLTERPWHEQWASRDETKAKMQGVLPPALLSLLSREGAEGGALRLHAFLQIPVLVRSLTYTLFDMLLLRLFPGIVVEGLQVSPYCYRYHAASLHACFIAASAASAPKTAPQQGSGTASRQRWRGQGRAGGPLRRRGPYLGRFRGPQPGQAWCVSWWPSLVFIMLSHCGCLALQWCARCGRQCLMCRVPYE